MDKKISRRTFINGSLAATAAVALGVGVPSIVTANPGTQSNPYPSTSGFLPPVHEHPFNLTDCHHHIYDLKFGKKVPANGTAEDYMIFQRRLGIKRHVVVTPSAYGTDNSCTVDALDKFGPSARGVAVVDTSVKDSELEYLNKKGIRGVRINVPPHVATTIDMIEPLSHRIKDLGWSMYIHMFGKDIVEIKDVLFKLPCPLVIDHFGRIPLPEGKNHPAFKIVCELLEKGKTWVKLSSCYQDSKVGAPSYADSGELAKAYAKIAPGRMLWGTDWPHPGCNPYPDDAVLYDAFMNWFEGDDKLVKKILVDNPAALYGFK